ncbi:MAG: SO_0444 family Cu/Zn efflux transporter [Pseudoflavonifractor sp.]|nr:SO_0444 family Cu/Zn efflux transporter [Alloprevotella sp.]MCM1117357.1 SO_0444 family Cu/Zn efflux transporter [Pseudoflavonifractor sp.]
MPILQAIIAMLAEMAPYILLGFLIAGLLHAFVPTSMMARHLSGRGWRPAVKAAALGIPLPLCSCGVLPTAVALRRGGASKAASTSFLIATPQTGIDSIAATASLLGPAFAIVRPFAALVTSFFGGIAVGAADKDVPSESADHCHIQSPNAPRLSFWQKIVAALRYGFIDLVGSIGGWLVAGLIIAALITVYLPADFLAALGQHPLLAMLAVVVLAVPMYVCATGSIPIAMSLMLKGLSPGAALVLLMAGPAANFASFALISREMGRRTALVYLASIVVGAMAFGLAIDYLMPARWFALPEAMTTPSAHIHMTPFTIACAALLALLLLVALIRRYVHIEFTVTNPSEMTSTFNIEGMNCPHCQAAVTKAISAVDGVESVEVSLSAKKATIAGDADPDDIIQAVRAAGFDAAPLP